MAFWSSNSGSTATEAGRRRAHPIAPFLVALVGLMAACGGGGEANFEGGGISDATPPTVTATSPEDGASGVPTDVTLSADFSEPIDTSTISAASFTLRPSLGGPAVVGAVSVSGNTGTFTPATNLADNTQYTATIAASVTDAAGNVLGAEYSWQFTAGVARMITGVSPAGPIQNGQILTINGSAMVQEDRSDWDPFFRTTPTASGFEGPDPASDDWTSEKFSYDPNVKLMGSQSALSHHAGESEVFPTNTPHSNISFNDKLIIGGDLYFRAYLRFRVANRIWADGFHKIFAMYVGTEGFFVDFVNNSNAPYRNISFLTFSGTQPDQTFEYSLLSLPGGGLQENRWYLLEAKFPSGPPHNYRIWIDNQLVVDEDGDYSQQGGTAFDMQLDVNHCCTPPGYSKDNWWDGFAISTSRVGPASLIEIGDSADYATATKVYQPPEELSDTSSQIKVDLTGLGPRPYFLWVTNNQGLRSQAFALP